MNKKKYYISVQSRNIMENQGDAAYELEIEATSEEIEELNLIFKYLEDFDVETYYRAHYPIPYHYDSENDGYDYYLKETYRILYRLGTKETKDHVTSMNILT